MSAMAARPASLSLPMVGSVALHVVAIGAVLYATTAPKASQAVLYHVELVAAPAGPRAEGVVSDAPEAPTPAPRAAESKRTPKVTKPVPKKATKAVAPPKPAKAATPNATAAPATKAPPPKAGGGEQGGTGADVANVLTAGIEFPFPGYLNNVVRQIALQFEVPRGGGALSAEVSFLIHRDGSATAIRLLTRSGSYVFDQACVGAVEAAARGGRFGPLPTGFTDDVLPVIFSFDPKRMR